MVGCIDYRTPDLTGERGASAMTGKHIFHEDFRLRPFWWEAAPPLSRAAALPDAVDVAVVGGGYAGLSAALHLARGGARVVVLEAGEFGAGASSRNAGLVSGGNYLGKGLKGLSDDEAAALMREASGALDLVEEIVAAERIDCGYERSGRVVAAAVPAHYAALEATLDRLNRHADARASMLPRDRQREEIASDAYGGGMIVRREADIELAGELPARLDALLPAHFEIDGQGLATFFDQIVDALGIEVGPAIEADKLAAQHLNLGIESDDRLLAIDFNDIVHGFTPCSSSHLRMLATAPLSVSGEGCGR
mgnify:CR=1 FL=1